MTHWLTEPLTGNVALAIRCLIFVFAANAAGVAVRLIGGRVVEARTFPASSAAAWHSVILYGSILVYAMGSVIIQLGGGLTRPLPPYFLGMYAAAPIFLLFGWLERRSFRARERATAAGHYHQLVAARVTSHRRTRR